MAVSTCRAFGKPSAPLRFIPSGLSPHPVWPANGPRTSKLIILGKWLYGHMVAMHRYSWRIVNNARYARRIYVTQNHCFFNPHPCTPTMLLPHDPRQMGQALHVAPTLWHQQPVAPNSKQQRTDQRAALTCQLCTAGKDPPTADKTWCLTKLQTWTAVQGSIGWCLTNFCQYTQSVCTNIQCDRDSN